MNAHAEVHDHQNNHEIAQAHRDSDDLFTAIPIDADGCITSDLLCIDCGYNLRGLANDDGAICPECGAALQRAIAAALSRFDQQWMRTVLSGVNLLLAAPLFGFIFIIIAAVLIAGSTGFGFSIVIAIMLIGIPVTSFVVGAWKFTSPSLELKITRPQTEFWRWTVRAAACALTTEIIAILCGFAMNALTNSDLFGAILVSVPLTLAIGTFSAGIYAFHLSTEAIGQDLSTHILWVTWFTAGLFLNVFVLVALANALFTSASPLARFAVANWCLILPWTFIALGASLICFTTFRAGLDKRIIGVTNKD